MKRAQLQACLFPTSLGTMALAWRGEKFAGVFLPEASEGKLRTAVRKRCGPGAISWTPDPPAFVGALAAKLRAHLRGESQEFSLDSLDLPGRSPFFRKVYEVMMHIPAGSLRTYGELAAEAGSPRAARAVGQAMAKNHFPIVIPCHRVVGSGKNPGGFSAHGGLATKDRILRLEHSSLE